MMTGILLGLMVMTGASNDCATRYDSYKGLVMTGYQGWFAAPGDGCDRGFYHYSEKGRFEPGCCGIDLWPDVSEYKKTYPTPFQFADSRVAHVFSSYDSSTVDVHFRWMKEYGIDGAFMQRFVSEIKHPKGKRQFDTVLHSAMNSAVKHNRALGVMYDLSGMRPGDETVVFNDIDGINKRYGLHTRDTARTYLHHNGRPLVTLWGVGFSDKRAYGFNEIESLMQGLKSRGYSIMLGVPTYWRDLNRDTSADSRLHTLIARADIIMPWFVGRYGESTYPPFKQRIKDDIAWTKQRGVDYAPLAFPGFSWKNMKGMDSHQIPRNNGSFFWAQLAGAIDAGAEMVYVAMFDEIDEATAIFKCSTEIPVGASYFLPAEKHLGNDHYLWLTSQAARMLKKQIPLTRSIPKR